jgi:hypothetical protein
VHAIPRARHWATDQPTEMKETDMAFDFDKAAKEAQQEAEQAAKSGDYDKADRLADEAERLSNADRKR